MEFRSSDEATLAKLDRALHPAVAEIAARRKVALSISRQIWRKEPTHFDANVIKAVETGDQRARLLQPARDVEAPDTMPAT